MRQSYPGWPAAQRPAPLAIFRPGRRLAAVGLLALGLAPTPGRAQGPATRPGPGFFQSDAAARTAAAASPLAATLVRSRALTLDEPGLRAALATAPLESRVGAAPLELALPQPDGSSARFALREAPIMEASLAARYPQIKTYVGVGLDDATASVRLDLTPQGFHAQVLSGTERGFDIDPARPTDVRHYLSYYRQDVKPAAAGLVPSCETIITPAQEKASAARVAAWRAGGGIQARATGPQLHTYRLALTCTPEYSLSRGNTKASVLAALVVTLNRVVGIMERELALRLELVRNNEKLIFLSGTGDQPNPALSDNNKNELLGQNKANITTLIGDSNYDLGHLINSGGGGVAGVGVPCSPSKADGISGDDVGTIAHEMGHQLGALHTFNGLSINNNTSNTAWEPGSGTTIMSYGGGSDPTSDVQPYIELLYHTGSYEAIQAVISTRSCGMNTPTGNTAPVVTAPASGKTLPISTPFQLTATASDADKDPLTYSWEELDLGPTGNLLMPQVTGQTPPLFRFWRPVSSPTRYFPRLNELVNNAAALGERLPTVTRGLKFRCTARDLHNGPAGVVGGVAYSDLVTLSVSAAAGPFLVTAPNAAGTSWAGGSTQTVRWDVAKTDKAPVSCAKVNLRLSLDGGLSYPLTLATGLDNNGSASVKLPNAPTTQARIMVEAADNYFFDISDVNFAITPAPGSGPTITSFTPTFGPVGTSVSITGTGLAGATGVAINGTGAALVAGGTATSLTATVTAANTSGLITVTTGAGTVSSVTPFLVGNPPRITSFTPGSGLAGSTVMLTGTNFLGATRVLVNGREAEVDVISATQLRLIVPEEATTGPLSVTTPLGTGTSSSDFNVLLRPVIDSFTPDRGVVGTTVVLAGRNFSGATRVEFGGIAATPLSGASNSDTELTVKVPAGAITGPLSVITTSGLGTSRNFFTVLPPPVITTMSPTSGVVGTTVTLTGTALDLVTNLTLNGATMTVRSQNATTITFVVPAGASTGPVVAATAVTSTSAGTFTVLKSAAGVVITKIEPASAITKATISLIGTGLSGVTQVVFTGSSGSTVISGFAVNAAGTALTGLVVPVGAVTGVITVIMSSGTGVVSSQVFTLCAKPLALAQNARLTLGAGGTATLAPTAVNSASTANCGAAAASTLSVVPNAFTTADLGPALVARALSFNGNGQYVAIGNGAPMPTGNTPYTIEAWIKPTTMSGNSIIGWGNWGAVSACNALRLSATGLINYWWDNDLEAPTPDLVGAWHHVAATCDGTTRTLYLDGKAIGSDRPGTHSNFNVDNLRIGSTNTIEFFNGNLDEVRVWNVARTAAQINAAKGAHLLGSPAGLVACYRFSEGSGTTTATTPGTPASLGTLTGGPTWTTDAAPVVNGVPVVLTVTDPSGYTSTAPAVVTVVAATATTAANATTFSVWPNPVGAKGLLHVSLVVPATAARLSLRNGLGQLVRARGFAGSTAELSTAGLASGLYLLSVQADGRAPSVRRVVVD